ncbi:hypothetical protein PAXRUDRAFT_8719 [Paxillus rubicundulus Ve08.2h10]|uniref:Uncharacterized protein n=1 Tax=Paxillus rubicundulus Ve08.2h10 TaxID=930991 RepID=A0A0D0ECP0_9AGAM|nr:hypothetical protein PAXRUDRAFT_8719 [Paxillus rubicundulus Ve08.2h10]
MTLARTLLLILLQGVALLAAYKVLGRTRKGAKARNTTVVSGSANDRDVNKHRGNGTWTPQRFAYPEITPCPHELKDVKPVPYRPFRWGEYHITMGIRSMPWSEWIALDSSYQAYQRIRSFRLRTRGRDAVRVLPTREDSTVRVRGGAEAAKELVYELAEYLPRRYPSSFRVSRLPSSSASSVPSIGGIPLSWDGEMPIRTIEVVDTGAKYDLNILETLKDEDMGEEAMKIVTGLVQEDVAIMIEGLSFAVLLLSVAILTDQCDVGSDGKYYFQAASICTPGFWRMSDKIGMPLNEIHVSGNVPQFKEKLEMSMERFFRRMPLDKLVIRNNYFIQVIKPTKADNKDARLDAEEATISEVDPEELGWSETTNGREDEFVHGHGHSAKTAPYVAASTLRLRSERQTLRRLPRTGGIVFGVRMYLFKVEELAQERGVAGRLASAVRSWPGDVAVYKGQKMYQDVLLRYLDECAEREGTTGPMEGMLGYPF